MSKKFLTDVELKCLKYMSKLDEKEANEKISKLSDEQMEYLNDLLTKYENYKLYLLDKIDEMNLTEAEATEKITDRHVKHHIKNLKFKAENLQGQSFDEWYYSELSEKEQKYVDKVLQDKENKKMMVKIAGVLIGISEGE